jgi:transcriptional regulator with XRE-family HTH domain
MEPASVAKVVGDRVRHLRTQLGWSAQRLADACAEAGHPSLTRSLIAKIESGVRQSVTFEELAVLARALGSPLADLMPREAEIQERRGRQTVARATPVSDSMRQSEFLAALREARRSAGLTQAQLANELGCAQSKVNKIEAGMSQAKPRELDIWLIVCNVPSKQQVRIRALAPTVGSARVSRAYMEMLTLQGQATEILALHGERIPKLLQSEGYTLRQYEGAGVLGNPSFVLREKENLSKLFTQEHPPSYRALLTEASLRRMPGGLKPDLVIDQATHLLTLMAAHPHVSVQIVTYAAEIPWLEPDFTLLKFEGERPVVYAEIATEGRIYRDSKLVAGRVEYWHQLQRAALTRDESRAWLDNLIKQAEADLRTGIHDREAY